MGIRKLDTTGTWNVNGSPIYIPDTETTILHSSLASEDSGRDEQGYMHIVWLRQDIYKVGLKYALMTGSELAYMRQLLQGKEFTFSFADENGVHIIEAYTSEINAVLYTRLAGVDIYKDVTINIIEK